MIQFKDVKSDGGRLDFEISLTKLVGKPIKDMHGYITREFGDPSFKLTRIEFEDGSELGVEGEHDCPYLTDRGKPQPNLNEETLTRLNEEISG